MYNEIDLDNIDLTQEPPANEPARQYYFMAKAGQYIRQREQRLGRKLTATVVTFGCQMNTEHEIEKAA